MTEARKTSIYFGTLIDRSKLPKTIDCKWCGQHICEQGKYYKTPGHIHFSEGFIAYFRHWTNCTAAQNALYKTTHDRASSDKAGRGYVNCPCCGETMRTDAMLRHIAAHHEYDCLLSMPIDVRKRNKTNRLPIVYGNVVKRSESGYSTEFYVCLHCRHGALASGKNKFALENYAKILTQHSECRTHYEKFAAYFDDETPTEYLPIMPRSMKKSELMESVGSTETVAPVPAPVNETVRSTECAKCAAAPAPAPATETAPTDQSPPPKELVAAVRDILGNTDPDDLWPIDELIDGLKSYKTTFERSMVRVRCGLDNQIAELKPVVDAVRAYSSCEPEDDPKTVLHEFKRAIERNEKRHAQEIQRLKARIAEMETVNSVYETIRFGYNGRKDDDY